MLCAYPEKTEKIVTLLYPPIDCCVYVFSDPLQVSGDGIYSLSGVKEFEGTEAYLNFDENTR